MSTTTRDNVFLRSIGNLRRSIRGIFSGSTSHGDASINSHGVERLPRATSHGDGSIDSHDIWNHGVAFMGTGGRSDHRLTNSHPQFLQSEDLFVLPDEWAFLMSFEQQYGTNHPNFYACRFMEALKMAEQEHKFMFIYLHSQEYPFTPTFCKEILCSELTTQFLDVNFVCWGALADRGEGWHMAAFLQPASFPFCAVIAPTPGASYEVLQKIEGPISPDVLVEILQKILEEEGLAFQRDRAKREEKIRADHRIREEQNVAYIEALRMDKEKEKQNTLASSERTKRQVIGSNTSHIEKRGNSSNQVRQTTTTGNGKKDTSRIGNDSQVTQILLRFPDGERREHSFLCTDKIQSIFRYIDSLGLLRVANYRLVSNFPRRFYGVDQMGITLKDAGLHPKASMFVEIVQ